jgi:hypothetical protein
MYVLVEGVPRGAMPPGESCGTDFVAAFLEDHRFDGSIREAINLRGNR